MFYVQKVDVSVKVCMVLIKCLELYQLKYNLNNGALPLKGQSHKIRLVYSIDNDRSEIGWLQKSSMGSRGKNLTEEVAKKDKW